METVELAEREFGGSPSAPVLVVLHGMLGSSRNWQSAARRLTDAFRVIGLDLRNHGESPHHPRMDYPAMAADVCAWMERSSLETIHLLGHSMGGKASMYLACEAPERVRTLTVVDIAPRAYPPRWEREFALMKRMPVGQFSRRSEAEEWLEEEIRDGAFRKFLVTNLERAPGGGFRWILNLDVLEGALPNLFRQVPEGEARYEGPTLFLRGSESRFVADTDRPMMEAHFPQSRLETVSGAGHNVHFDKPDPFAAAVREHLSGGDAR